MRLLALMIKSRLLDEIGGRISGLSESQVDGWLKGHVSLADELLGRHGQVIMEHREVALDLTEEVTVEEVRERLLGARPDLRDRWESPEFDRAFERELRRIRDYLGTDSTAQGDTTEVGADQ
jgi:hypothetical protein